MVFTSLAVILLPWGPGLFAHPHIGNVPHRWELENYRFDELLTIMETTLGLHRTFIGACFATAVSAFLLLFMCDNFLKLEWQDFMCPAVYSKVFKEMGTRGCYDEMFCEPARAGERLVARPGNTYSNVIYLFNGILVTSSALFGSTHILGPPMREYNHFWASDLFFGVMMICLSGFSVLWHATNLPLAHYPDLWSMDSCIAYEIVRYVFFGLQILIFGPKGSTDASDFSTKCIPVCCFIAFACVVWLIGTVKWRGYEARQLHYSCEFSGRARLVSVAQKGESPQRFSSMICVFGGLPVVYAIPMFFSQVVLLGSLGSVELTTIGLSFLVLGWSYRMCEKFLLDNSIFMEMALSMPKSTLRTVVTALVSPTAVLHWSTGFTLLFGYLNIMSYNYA
jgi:hypothetical protein